MFLCYKSKIADKVLLCCKLIGGLIRTVFSHSSFSYRLKYICTLDKECICLQYLDTEA